MDKAKVMFLGITTLVSGAVSNLLGGWDIPIDTLFFFIVADYFMGLCLAGVFKKSPKTESGALSSTVGLKGIAKKVIILVIVGVAVKLDLILGIDFIRTGTIFAFCANEVLSITESAGLMLGYDVPKVVRNAVDVLVKKNEGGK